jgi:hypothetical protein
MAQNVFEKWTVLGTGLLCALISCQPSRFSGYSPARKAPPPEPRPVEQVVQSGSIILGCDGEAASAVRGNTNSLGVPVSFQSICSSSMQSSQAISKRRPVDFVFVLDVTKSMQPNIDAVKNNIADFALRLGGKGWDGRFAAVAYRDPPGSTVGHINDPAFELLYTVPFKSDSELAAELASGKSEWVADDKSDNQEGGQAAISAGLDMLAAHRRFGADGVMLFVTDAPSFAGSDHWNFSIESLANKMSQVSNFKFYHSTLSVLSGDALRKYGSLSSDSRWQGARNYNVAKNQIEDLRKVAGKSGGWLNFPLARSTFIDALPSQFETVVNTIALICRVTQARVIDSRNQTLMIYEAAQTEMPAGSTIEFSGGIEVPGSYVYEEKRCCMREGAAFGACEKNTEVRGSITIK